MIPRRHLLTASATVLTIGLAMTIYGFTRHDTPGDTLAWIGSGVIALTIIDLIRTHAWRNER